jgi:nicotinamidase-related amidase
MPIPRLRLGSAALLVIDVQERLLPTIVGGTRLAERCAALVGVAHCLEMPVLVTEQYVKGLGRSVSPIASALRPGDLVVEKTRFSGAVPEVLAALERARISHVLLCGIEAHVCVLQTALDLLAGGRQVFLATDAISSGQASQVQPALQRMQAAGATLSGVLGATYELLGDASDPRFRTCLGLVRGVVDDSASGEPPRPAPGGSPAP